MWHSKEQLNTEKGAEIEKELEVIHLLLSRLLDEEVALNDNMK